MNYTEVKVLVYIATLTLEWKEMDQSAAFNISTIAKMVGSDLVEPMLVSYQETMQAQLTKLITIVATQSTSELHRLAHSIKSSAKFIGSDALSEFCFQLEMKRPPTQSGIVTMRGKWKNYVSEVAMSLNKSPSI